MVAAVFVVLALVAGTQVVRAALGRSGDPRALTALQALVCLTGAATAWGSWAGRRWAAGAAALHGIATAGLPLALAPLLDLPPEARGGLWAAAASALLLALGTAWYLRRALAARGPAARRPP